jgi:hypothetical protein
MGRLLEILNPILGCRHDIPELVDSDDENEGMDRRDMLHLVHSDGETYIGSPTNADQAKERIDARWTYGSQCYLALPEKKYP